MKNGETWTEETFEEAEALLGYRFSDRKRLLAAFTHPSYSNVSGEESYERLEFLGDAVLEHAVTEWLFETFPAFDEGKLTELRKQYVSQDALTLSEGRLGLIRFLRYSGGESNIKGKTNSNLFEAVVGAIYLDGGFGAVKEFLVKNLVHGENENYKTQLQEYVQKRQKDTPRYHVREEDGKFVCTVSALGMSATGMGASKKTAETEAAAALLNIFSKGKNFK